MTPERFKVVALMAYHVFVQADRVAMSIAIVTLVATYGWNRSLLGIVQAIINSSL